MTQSSVTVTLDSQDNQPVGHPPCMWTYVLCTFVRRAWNRDKIIFFSKWFCKIFFYYREILYNATQKLTRDWKFTWNITIYWSAMDTVTIRFEKCKLKKRSQVPWWYYLCMESISDNWLHKSVSSISDSRRFFENRRSKINRKMHSFYQLEIFQNNSWNVVVSVTNPPPWFPGPVSLPSSAFLHVQPNVPQRGRQNSSCVTLQRVS